jgi:AraC-like DNA-binding protein/ligand-binding sensor protein
MLFVMGRINVFLEDKVKDLIDSFSYCFKVGITFFSADLDERLVVGLYPMCSYCRLVRDTLHLKHRCQEQDRKMCLRSLKSASPQFYVCHAGMVDAVFPIRLEEWEDKTGMMGVLVGYAMIGQFRTRRAIPYEISQEWQKSGFDAAVLQSAFDEQAFFEHAALENMLNLFSMLCDFIVSKRYIRRRYVDIVTEAVRWVEKHIASPLVFSDLEKHLGYNQRTILYALKKRLNMNFKQLCTLKKVERFERIVSESPSITIEEAAFRLGYGDASYFSRVYKKARATTPSAFIKTVQRGGGRV